MVRGAARPRRRGTRPLVVFVVLLALMLPGRSGAQTIRGVVLEEGATDPSQGATIELLRPDSTLEAAVLSDEKGWFQILAQEAGTYLLRPSHLSFTATRVDSVSAQEHEIVTVVLRMGRRPIPLEPLVVVARTWHPLAGFYERSQAGGLGKFVHRDFIQPRIASLPSQLLIMTPGIRLFRSEDGMSNTITMWGVGGRCTPSVYLDGLPVPAGITTIDDLTASEMIEGIEIYDSYAVPPHIFPIRRDEYCGIVAFWSRREAFRPMGWKKWWIAVLSITTFVLLSRMR